jgi:hypothetical protein
LLGDVETVLVLVLELGPPVVVVVGAVDVGEVVGGDFGATVVVVLATSARAVWPLDLDGTLLYRPTTNPVVRTTPATATSSHLFHLSPPLIGIWRWCSFSFSPRLTHAAGHNVRVPKEG